ncbi:helix-turn-helix domain-containing protein [Nocardia elegans]|uniref:Helix-turn-helix domain-containing protein n=1 Tax=Nocardia elegans TaxID=300029 RepID=A0ABW6TMF1_9NOCA
MARKRTTPVEVLTETQQKRNTALAMRLAGKQQQQIAQEMGVHKSTVSVWIKEAIADITRENAEEYLELELSRLDAMLAAIWPDIIAGEKGAEWKIDRALAIMEQRAKLTGTYKAADLRAIAEAKGTVSSGTTSMVGRFFDMLEKAYETDATDPDASAEE